MNDWEVAREVSNFLGWYYDHYSPEFMTDFEARQHVTGFVRQVGGVHQEAFAAFLNEADRMNQYILQRAAVMEGRREWSAKALIEGLSGPTELFVMAPKSAGGRWTSAKEQELDQYLLEQGFEPADDLESKLRQVRSIDGGDWVGDDVELGGA